MRNTILLGDALEQLRTLPDESMQCCVTSPPYFGLRDYGAPGQIGLEETPAAYVAKLVEVFAEVRRVLRPDGTLWLNLGDSYAGSWGNYAPRGIKGVQRARTEQGKRWERRAYDNTTHKPATASPPGYKPKDLMGIPWRVAFALQDDGWWLREDIIWSKPNGMPESVQDRCTRSHEYIFHFAKSERYYHDAAAIHEPAKETSAPPLVPPSVRRTDKQRGHSRRHAGFNDRWDAMSREEQSALGANKRSVWTVATVPFPGAHFATFPPALIEPCILAGAPAGALVLDPFMGAGTVGYVAQYLGRDYLGIELNASYRAMAMRRIRAAGTPLAAVAAVADIPATLWDIAD